MFQFSNSKQEMHGAKNQAVLSIGKSAPLPLCNCSDRYSLHICGGCSSATACDNAYTIIHIRRKVLRRSLSNTIPLPAAFPNVHSGSHSQSGPATSLPGGA